MGTAIAAALITADMLATRSHVGQNSINRDQFDFAEYELAGDIPVVLKGREIATRISKNLDAMHLLVADGKPENVRALAQAQYNVLVQRQIRNFLDSEDVALVLAGGTVAEGDLAGDWSQLSEDERVTFVTAEAEDIGLSWAYGGARAPSTGTSRVNKENKQKAEKFDAIAARAAADPEYAKKLAKLGIEL